MQDMQEYTVEYLASLPPEEQRQCAFAEAVDIVTDAYRTVHEQRAVCAEEEGNKVECHFALRCPENDCETHGTTMNINLSEQARRELEESGVQLTDDVAKTCVITDIVVTGASNPCTHAINLVCHKDGHYIGGMREAVNLSRPSNTHKENPYEPVYAYCFLPEMTAHNVDHRVGGVPSPLKKNVYQLYSTLANVDLEAEGIKFTEDEILYKPKNRINEGATYADPLVALMYQNPFLFTTALRVVQVKCSETGSRRHGLLFARHNWEEFIKRVHLNVQLCMKRSVFDLRRGGDLTFAFVPCVDDNKLKEQCAKNSNGLGNYSHRLWHALNGHEVIKDRANAHVCVSFVVN